ncbi:MAG: aminotransferase class V-fold PLP-dependent enzyme [Bacteroidota bacterium]
MSLNDQRHLFNLSSEITYLNGAYMSPQLRSVEALGVAQLQKKSRPDQITVPHFFEDKERLRSSFAQLIHTNDPQRIAIIPSVSFGIGTALKNIPFERGDEIVVLEEQFPSNFYAWKQLEAEQGVVVTTISAPPIAQGRAQHWNEQILEAISSQTKCVALPQVHWADGTRFDLPSVRQRTNDVGAYMVVDGTQSVGAMPFSVEKIKPDALICAGYKWLMGAYGLGVAYYGERFDNGLPLDNNWMNHEGANDFANLVNYNTRLKPKAARYDIGESSNFILVPMLAEGIQQLLKWTPESIQDYCRSISTGALEQLRDSPYFVENEAHRGHHLFGIYLPDNSAMPGIKEKLASKGIFVSYRGNAIRISPHVYNTKTDMEKLVSCFV